MGGSRIPIALPIPRSPGGSRSPRARTFEVAFDGTDRLAFLTGGRSCFGNGPLTASLRRLDGSVERDVELAPDGAQSIVQIAAVGTGWVAAWLEQSATSQGFCNVSSLATKVVRLDATGSIVAGPRRFAGVNANSIAAFGDDIYLTDQGAAGVTVRRLDLGLVEVGAPVVLSRIKSVWDVQPAVGGVAVLGSGEPVQTAIAALVRAGALVRETELQKVASTAANVVPIVIAEDAAGVMICWQWAGGASCRALSASDFTAKGPAFIVSTDVGRIALARAACRMALLSEASGVAVAHQLTPAGEVDSRTVDRSFEGTDWALRAFADREGRLVRVTHQSVSSIDGGSPEGRASITTFSCRGAAPAADCAVIRQRACEVACQTCRGTNALCSISAGPTTNGFAPTDCPTRIAATIDCARVDLGACQERLAEPAECRSESWMLPADCSLPK